MLPCPVYTRTRANLPYSFSHIVSVPGFLTKDTIPTSLDVESLRSNWRQHALTRKAQSIPAMVLVAGPPHSAATFTRHDIHPP
jgi:hypothetical protein